MAAKILRFFIAILMFFSPSLLELLDLPKIAKGQELQLEERFKLVWEDEFEGERYYISLSP